MVLFLYLLTRLGNRSRSSSERFSKRASDDLHPETARNRIRSFGTFVPSCAYSSMLKRRVLWMVFGLTIPLHGLSLINPFLIANVNIVLKICMILFALPGVHWFIKSSICD